jgi:hypothetical protein
MHVKVVETKIRDGCAAGAKKSRPQRRFNKLFQCDDCGVAVQRHPRGFDADDSAASVAGRLNRSANQHAFASGEAAQGATASISS